MRTQIPQQMSPQQNNTGKNLNVIRSGELLQSLLRIYYVREIIPQCPGAVVYRCRDFCARRSVLPGAERTVTTFFVIYMKDLGKHWKNDFFCDKIDHKSV